MADMEAKVQVDGKTVASLIFDGLKARGMVFPEGAGVRFRPMFQKPDGSTSTFELVFVVPYESRAEFVMVPIPLVYDGPTYGGKPAPDAKPFDPTNP